MILLPETFDAFRDDYRGMSEQPREIRLPTVSPT